MVVSTLCRKVFDQVGLEENLLNAFWVEGRLQLMQINGLVKMIQGSKKLDIQYIDGYLARYKWAFRPVVLDIAGCFDIYCLLQQFDQDFPWGQWSELAAIKNIEIFKECILFASQNFKPLVYALAMYRGKVEELKNMSDIVNKAISNQSQIVVEPISEAERRHLDEEWNKMKHHIANTARWDESLCN